MLGPDAKEALPALIGALAEEDVEVLKKVIYTLGEMGRSADPAARLVNKSMDNEDEDVRKAVAYALAAMGPGARTGDPRLDQGAARQGDVRPARRRLCDGRLGRKHPQASAFLLESLKDPDDDVREEVAFAIGEIGTDEKPIIGALRTAYSRFLPTVRAAAQEAIDKLQDDDDDDEPKKEDKPPKP